MRSTSVRLPASRRLGIGAVFAAGTLAVTGLAFAPAAAAVAPTSATVTYNCGLFGGGSTVLSATQSGTSATITVTSNINAPLALAADSIASTLTMSKAGGGTTAFTGTKNPATASGTPVVVGPLTGTVASGDSLDAGGGTLKMVLFGITVTCTPTGNQSPGPFVYA
ncbi:hypothetical protein ACOT81_15235 [Streptomyces sp. WI04-05B]|uniref:hypothetical protein n=1 Tax=Streptomyces TaxID=1883 RepID=UPI0029A85343|nr:MULTISPECIES: hypothetical protein [unclassified Streptomyces]MDX2540269.1 hypothetical protein [Streptomyces sp. WI04-05B]MDX2585298.1 hypothetical protein [Streptomyces sp. WI04-05A]MDX3753376.1 hypothetical protein [Streptomyces sp. AK08-02]